MAKNEFKPKEEKGKGLNIAFCDEIKEKIAKRKVISARFTEDEYELINKIKNGLTDNAYIRELVKQDINSKNN